MRTLPWVLVVVLAGCEEKKAAPTAMTLKANLGLPAEAPENVADRELKRFLDGMLVTSDVPPPNEPTWPTGDDGSMQFWIRYIARQKFDVEGSDELKAVLQKPIASMTQDDAWLIGHMWNYPLARRVYEEQRKAEPLDLETADWLGFYVEQLEGPKAGLDLLKDIDLKKLQPPRTGKANARRAEFEMGRCVMAFNSGQYDLARRFCGSTQELDEERGARVYANTLLALGKKKEGLAQAELAAKVPGASTRPNTFLTVGLAQQLNGQDANALTTWNLALSRWPEYAPLGLAASGARKSVAEWAQEEQRTEDDKEATRLSYCGYVTAELGLTEQSEACYAAADRHLAGPALAHRLVFLSRTDLPEAHRRLTEAVEGTPHRHLMSALAYVLFQEGQYAAARAWLEKVLAEKWNDPKATSLMWQVCGKQNDFVCVIEYRKRLGLPTHFNVEQYREVSRAWKEQAQKNGVGLSAREPASKDAPPPPPVRAITIVSLGNRIPPELEGLDAVLTAQFPGLAITFGPQEDLVGVVKPGQQFALWERVVEHLREEPGALYVIEYDLGFLDRKFAFSHFDLGKGRGVASLSRLRSLTGQPLPPRVTLEGEVLRAAQTRVTHQLANGVGKLAGLSFPCEDSSCPMFDRRSVKDFSVTPAGLCPKHKAELAARLSAK